MWIFPVGDEEGCAQNQQAHDAPNCSSHNSSCSGNGCWQQRESFYCFTEFMMRGTRDKFFAKKLFKGTRYSMSICGTTLNHQTNPISIGNKARLPSPEFAEVPYVARPIKFLETSSLAQAFRPSTFLLIRSTLCESSSLAQAFQPSTILLISSTLCVSSIHCSSIPIVDCFADQEHSLPLRSGSRLALESPQDSKIH
jgi:hypothetical protein